MTARAGERIFSGRAIALLAGIVAVSLGGMILLAGFGERLGGPAVSGPSAYSVSALGHAAALEFLRGEGVAAIPRRSAAVARPGTHAPLVLAEPGGQAELDPLFAEAEAANAPVVVFLPKRYGAPQPQHPRWLSSSDTLGTSAIRALAERVLERAEQDAALDGEPTEEGLAIAASARLDASCSTSSGARYMVSLTDAQLLRPAPGLEPVATCDGNVLIARLPRGERVAPWYIVADPDLLATHGLPKAGHAALLRALFIDELRAQAAVFDETIHGLTTRPGVIEEFFSFPLVIVVVHALAMAALVVWAGSVRFGRPREAAAALTAGKAALVESAAQLAVARRPAALAAMRLTEARMRRLARDLGLRGAITPGPDLAARIDAVLAARGLPARARAHWQAMMQACDPGATPFSRFRSAAHATARHDVAVMTAATAMHDWLQEISHGTRGTRRHS